MSERTSLCDLPPSRAAAFDWQEFLRARPPLGVVDCKRRLRWMLAGFVLAVAMVLARAVWLEVTGGEPTRALASRPIERAVPLPALRGRIVTGDGTVLAVDRPIAALSMHYRYLEEPANGAWLRHQARQGLSARQRRDPAAIGAQADRLRVERAELHRRLAALCEVRLDEWDAARSAVQQRVERIAARVNARRQVSGERRRASSAADGAGAERTWTAWLKPLAADALLSESEPPSAGWISIAEELDYHLLLPALSDEAAAEIESDPAAWPGVRIVRRPLRTYPQHELAAHVVGHLAKEPTGGWTGVMGLERQYERLLRGTEGRELQQVDRRGQVLASRVVRAPQPGRDLVVTLDAALQRWAERLLDGALATRALRGGETRQAGGAIVVLDCRDGRLLALAAAPRFDPGVMLGGPSDAVQALLADARKPLFDRSIKMALPPGSTIKPITAAALLEQQAIGPHQPFHCQGYLRNPGAHRCMIYGQFGLGHGDVTLAAALAQSCNVYFFEHAAKLGPRPLADWMWRFGLGLPTGIDLPDEAAGRVPPPEQLEPRQTSEALALSIGQGTLTATPLQMARAAAAIAGGGLLVVPHVVAGRIGNPSHVEGLTSEMLAAIREGMEQAVTDPAGTAHAALADLDFPVAVKTGTAETGGNRPPHAWIAGYAPADNPRLAFAVVLEHGGSGTAAASVAQQLLRYVQQTGHFWPARQAARRNEASP